MLLQLDRATVVAQLLSHRFDDPESTGFIDGFCKARGVEHFESLPTESLNELLGLLGWRDDAQPIAPPVLTGPPFFTCELPFTPHSVNESLRPVRINVGAGGGYTRLSMTPKAKATMDAMTLKFRCARLLQDFKLTKFPVEAKVILKIDFTFPDYIVRDISNRIKSLEDALVKAEVIQDDSLIYSLIVGKSIEKGIRKTGVSMWRYEEWLGA